MGYIEIVTHDISENGVTEIVTPWDQIDPATYMEIMLGLMEMQKGN
jgi:hypothetical protein